MKQRFLAFIAAASLCSGAQANSMQANISALFQLSGKVYVQMTSVAWDGQQTTCTPATPLYMIDPATAVGRAQLSLVLTAKEANHRVYLVGDGVCVGGGPMGFLAESLIGIQLQ
jgi:hypothetical protein